MYIHRISVDEYLSLDRFMHFDGDKFADSREYLESKSQVGW
jgi:hypothetical protein